MTNPSDHIVNSNPILRWAGGKRWLVPYLDKIFTNLSYNNYVEPFFGGGSVFFKIITKPSFLSDSNSELINTYRQIKNEPKTLIERLKKIPQNKETYIKIRDEEPTDMINKAVRFIYLNKTSFNGIYRVNSKGKYNVPYGKRNFSLEEVSKAISSCSEKLRNAELRVSDFEDQLTNINKNSLVYFDPPYTVNHNANGFIEYNEKIFSLEDQYRLSAMIDKVDALGAKFVLSNANHKLVEEIFLKKYNKKTFFRSSVVSGTLEGRGKYGELLITNIKI